MNTKRFLTLLIFSTMTVAVGCADTEQQTTGNAEPVIQPVPLTPPPAATDGFEELYDQGIDRYLGMFVPSVSVVSETGGTLHYFDVDPEYGPMCFTGNQFYMATRDGLVDDLMIFVEGGGFCSELGCAAVDFPFPGGVPNRGIMNRNDPDNAAATFNMAYIPYCDGTFHAGDNNVDSDGDGVDDRFFRGLQNLSASLDVVVNTYPAPSRIVLIGNSAGGFGVHFALPLVRKLFPTVPIDLVNDSGVGIANKDVFASFFAYWGANTMFPASCNDCIGEDGNLTGYHSYQLRQDGNVRMAFLSSEQDEAATANPNVNATEWQAQLIEAVAELEQAYPERFRSLIAEGDSHTFVQRQFTRQVGDTSVNLWLNAMLNNDDNWESVSD